ncbi:MAG: type VI secretion system tip protein TssI/VgrG [Myxococcales bacterium]
MPTNELTHQMTLSGSTQPVVVAFEGRERLSELFDFHVSIACPLSLDFDAVVGAPASLTLCPRVGASARTVHGIVSHLELVEVRPRVASHPFLYKVSLVPNVWRLTLNANSRIFQQQKVVDVLLAVLGGGGGGGSIKRRFALQGSYPTLEICVQYRESDWTFACRLMEENGIAYFFEHSDDATTLVLSDRPPSASAAIELRYRPAHATVRESDYGLTICALVLSQQLRPGKVTLHDWDFQKPSVLLKGEKTSGRASADSVEVYEHPAAQVTHEGAADSLAITTLAVRHEGLRTAGSQGRATSRSVSLVPGVALRVLEHPHDALNDVYLVTSLDHSGAQAFETGEASQKSAYENVVTMIPLGVMFRPLHQTHRPVIHGVQTAIVVGPPGEEIHVDEHGRVKVQFHWDRLGKRDASSSCWVRVSQGWAGAGWGTVKSDQRDTVQGKWAIKVQAGVTLECGASKVSVEPGGKIVIEGMQIEVKCAGPLKVQGTVVSVKADGVVQVQAPVVELKAEAGVKVKGAMIALDGSVVTLG